MFNLFLDLETTGLPEIIKFGKYHHYTEFDKYKNCRILSICMYLVNDQGEIIKKFYRIIRPDDFEIKNSHIHGITEDVVKKEGVEWKNMIEEIRDIITLSKLLVGHNIIFDQNVLASELYRRGYLDLASNINNLSNYCTMINGKNVTAISREGFDDFKYPKLGELYKCLFREEMKNAHNAEYDVINTIKCYYKMIGK